MSPQFQREKLFSTGFCLLGLIACAIMWVEADLHHPERKLNFFGDTSNKPLTKNKHPEAPLAFVAIGMVALIAGLWGLAGKDDQPVWWTHGIGQIVAGAVFGFLLVQVRLINGHDMMEFQPGFYLGMLVVLGLIVTGVKVITGHTSLR